jgi:hypothetical protein
MSSKLQIAVKSILTGAVLSLGSTGAFASGAVSLANGNWTGGVNTIGANSEIQTASEALNKDSYTGNAAGLADDGWGHTGTWLTFDVTAANQTVSVQANVLTGNNDIGFTVWASGTSAFNGGSPGYTEVSSVTGGNPAHDFNQVGQVGAFGTVWATDPSVTISPSAISQGAPSTGQGNLLDTLAYANNGVATAAGASGYGQTINNGVNQVATDNNFFTGSVGGSVGSTYAELIFSNLAVGNYAIFVGGANSASTQASTYDVTVTTTTAVPLPGAVYLFGAALAGIMANARRKLKLA